MVATNVNRYIFHINYVILTALPLMPSDLNVFFYCYLNSFIVFLIYIFFNFLAAYAFLSYIILILLSCIS